MEKEPRKKTLYVVHDPITDTRRIVEAYSNWSARLAYLTTIHPGVSVRKATPHDMLAEQST
jgi:hypothetical protein